MACKSVQFWAVSRPEKDFASRIQCWTVQPGSRDWRRWQCSQAMDFIKKLGGSPSYGSGKSLDFHHSSQQFIPHHHWWFPVVLVILWPTEPSFLEWEAGRREGIAGDHAQRSLLHFQLPQQVWKQQLCPPTRHEHQWETAKNEMEVQVRRCKQTFSCWIQIDMYTARQICSFLSLKFTRVQLHHPAPIQRVHNRIKRPTAEESDQENWVLTQTWTLNFSVVPFLCCKTWI